MKLRNFHYINKRLLDDYIAAIDGYVYEDESQKLNETNQKTVGGKIGFLSVSGDGKFEKHSSEERERRVYISDAAKVDKLYDYLSKDNYAPLKYYEALNDTEYNNLCRDNFIEVLVTPRFSKTKQISDAAKSMGELAEIFKGNNDQSLLDAKAEEAIKGFSALSNLKSGNGISCVFSFENNMFPFIARLDESCFKCEPSQFVGQFYMLCKVQRKINKGESVKLDEIFEDIKKLTVNREQRRKMPKNMNNPEIIRDVVKGPALQVIPVAIYQ